MKKMAIFTACLVVGLGWLMASPARAITINELTELCKAGYSTADILQFVETLGLDEPLDSDALVRLKEEGCTNELAVELMRAHGEEEEESPVEDTESSSRVYVYAGWGYPYYGNSWGADWYSPWGGVRIGWYDPWSWDSWYWPRYNYYYPNSHWAGWPYYHHYWGGDRYWDWCRSDYQDVTAHQKNYRSRPGLITRAKSDAAPGGYRARVSRVAVEKSYASRAGYAARVSAVEKSGAARTSKSEYRVEGRSTDKSAVTSSRSVKKGSTATQGGTYRKSEPGMSKNKGSARSRGSSGAIKRSTPSDRSSGRETGRSPSSRSTRSGAHAKSSAGASPNAPPATSSGKSGEYSAPPPSSSSGNSTAPPSSSGSPRPRRR